MAIAAVGGETEIEWVLAAKWAGYTPEAYWALSQHVRTQVLAAYRLDLETVAPVVRRRKKSKGDSREE